MVPITPRGFKDILPEEARIREDLRKRAAHALDLWGYAPIETPALEVLDVIEQGSKVGNTTFKLFDGDNNLLVMRPDTTLAIARMVASRLPNAGKLRFRYDLSVFRDIDSSKQSSREFTQVGLEQIGYAGPEADAETLVVSIESLLACGLADFKIDFCNVEVLKRLLEAAGLDDDFDQSVKNAYHTSNYVKLDAIVNDAQLPQDLAAALKGLIRVHGGRQAIDDCKSLLGDYVRSQVFDDLAKTWDIVESCGYAGYVEIDFSLLGSFDYYTGLIAEAYAPGFGKPIGSGGRYDNLLEVFGKSMPAAGFAYSLERLMHALSVQGNLVAAPRSIEVVEGCDQQSFARAMQLHAQGKAAQIGGLQ